MMTDTNNTHTNPLTENSESPLKPPLTMQRNPVLHTHVVQIVLTGSSNSMHNTNLQKSSPRGDSPEPCHRTRVLGTVGLSVSSLSLSGPRTDNNRGRGQYHACHNRVRGRAGPSVTEGGHFVNRRIDDYAVHLKLMYNHTQGQR